MSDTAPWRLLARWSGLPPISPNAFKVREVKKPLGSSSPPKRSAEISCEVCGGIGGCGEACGLCEHVKGLKPGVEFPSVR